MHNIAVVCVAYNRVESLKRLVTSLLNAKYYSDKVDLIISIDKSDSMAVFEYSESINWPFGVKKIYLNSINMGLRKHIISLGKYFQDYEALIILEDDLVVSPAFYNFSRKCVLEYSSNLKIAGISLYTNSFNQTAMRSFVPLKTSSDIYYMQYASSWGQVWLKKQWKEFKQWYDENETLGDDIRFPKNITSWPKSSWLKFHISYCISENKYFFYPYSSFTSNFGEVGEHFNSKTNRFQVQLDLGFKDEYIFDKLRDSNSVYDAFHENIRINRFFDFESKDLIVDMYGTKNIPEMLKKKNKYILTTKILNFKVIESYAMEMVPHEQNILYNIQGNDIFLYDSMVYSKNKFKEDSVKKFIYDSRGLVFKKSTLIKLVFRKIFNKRNSV